MEIKDFELKLAEMKTALEAKAKADVAVEVKEQLKAIEAALAVKDTQTAEQLKKLADDTEITIKAFELFQKNHKAVAMPGAVAKNFGTELGEKLTAKAAELKEFKMNKKGFGAIEMESKVVGNMATLANLTGAFFVAPTVVPGIQVKPFEQIHMRDLLPTGTTTSNVVRYVRDNGGEGGPAMVAEGGLKPQMDRYLAILDANVRKIATYFRVPEEMIEVPRGSLSH